jgi:hypothetical protein
VASTSKEDDEDLPAPEEAPNEEIVGEYQKKRCSSTLDTIFEQIAFGCKLTRSPIFAPN